MRTTPARMIVFRLLNLTLCRCRSGDRLMRAILKFFLDRKDRSKPPYCQAADFFSLDQLTQSSADRRRGTKG